MKNNIIEKNEKYNEFINFLNKRNDKSEIFVSNGWIDSHVHIAKTAEYKISIDIGNAFDGVTTIIDAGTSGLKTLKTNIEWNKKMWKQNIFYLLNVSSDGLLRKDELNNAVFEKDDILKELSNPAVIGIKLRYSSQSIGNDFVTYKKIMNNLNDLDCPIVYHSGSEPPEFDFLVSKLRKKDFLTHIYNDKNENILNYLKSESNKSNLDVGFGHKSFALKKFDQINKLGIAPDTISTDLHDLVLKANPVLSISTIMSLFLDSGYDIDEIVNMVTINPYYKLITPEKYQEYKNIFTAFKIVDKKLIISDSYGEKRTLNKVIVPIAISVNGEVVEYE